jgi:hypothetical protein
MKRIFVSHLQNTRKKNDTNTANKPVCVDILKGRKTEKKMLQLVTARMENKKRGHQEDHGKDGLMRLKRV